MPRLADSSPVPLASTDGAGRGVRRGAVTLLCAGLLVGAAACGDEPAPTAAESLASRADTGLAQAYTATYDVTDPKSAGTTGSPGAGATSSAPATPGAPAPVTSIGTVTVHRSGEDLRLDVRTSTGTATSITTKTGTVACQLPANGRAATCLQVAKPLADPPAAFDPSLRAVFSSTLRSLAASDGGITVDAAGDVTAAEVSARCFTVTSPAERNVDDGTYCFSEEGVPVKVTFDSGTATLTTLNREAPAAAVFAPPAKPVPLPTT